MQRTCPKLYTRNTNGSVNVWWAEIDGNAYTTSYGQIDGQIQTSKPIFASPKSVGKTNETTADRQAIIEVQNLYKKQRKSNYFDSIDDIDTGFLEPQLAKPNADYIDSVVWADGQIVDHKLNGFACIITRRGAFTRTNEQYHAIPHILEDLKDFFIENPNAYLQGELFNPVYVKELDQIARLIAVTRQPKDITPELLAQSKKMVQYHLYDGYGFANVTIDSPNIDRRHKLISMIQQNGFTYCIPIAYVRCYSFEAMKAYADSYIARGGEGVIIRNPNTPYVHKRTKNLLKWKKFEDAEFKIIEVCEGKGNWAGCAKKAWCELPKGKREKRFKTNIEGTQEHLREVLKNKDKYVGKWITVRFQEYSPFNVPLIPYTDMVVRKEVEG